MVFRRFVNFKGHIFQRTLILSYACLSGSTTQAIHLKIFSRVGQIFGSLIGSYCILEIFRFTSLIIIRP
jgi:hypothetical protein